MGLRAIHVDADRTVLDETAPVLETNDIGVTPVTSAEEALAMLREAEVDCVILGVELGDADVVDLVGRLRNDYPELPVVIYADTWELGRASRAVTAGVTDMVFRDHAQNPELALVSRVQSAVDRVERSRGEENGAVAERYRRLVESSPAPIVIYDADGTLIYANEAAARFANADDPTELVGRHATTFVPEDELEWVEDRMRRVLDDRETVPQTELEFRALDGEPKYAVDVSAPITYRGEPAGQTVLHDVTALKQREEELKRSRRRLETLIDNIPGMVYRCSTVESPWPMEFVGGQVEELTGYAAETIEDDEVLWGEDVVLPDDLNDVERGVVEGVEAGESFELTYRIVTADDRVKHVWEQGEAVREDGEVVALEGVIMDVTAQRERERTLEEQESYRRDLYRIANDDDLVPMERVEEMLRVGTERFDVGIGFLASIDEANDRHEVVVAVGDHDLIRAGAVAPIDQTYCREVLQSDDVVGVNEAVEEGWEDDPAYIEYGFGCYIGGKVHLHGELYGTICFADEESRATPFDHGDRMFVELLARAVSHELDMMQEPAGEA